METEPDFGMLPAFPSATYSDEWRIECAIQRLVDRADKIYMSAQASQSQYDSWHKALNDWANSQYDNIRR